MGIFVSTEDGEVIEGTDDIDSMTAVHNNVTLNGNAEGDNLFSAAGTTNTTMDGGAGVDFLTGNGDNDTASYASSQAGVTVDLFVEDFGFGAAFDDGHGTQDVLIEIENVTGSAFADSLTGDSGANVIQGGAGDDVLTGDGGADVFNYSFELEPGQGGTSTFTDWLSEKYGRDFGDELPDFSPKHHNKHDKHDKHDKDDRDGDHGRNDKHDNHGKDDQHDKHGKDDGHRDHCGGDRHHPQDGGLTENFFEKNYKEWLEEVVVTDLLAQGFVLDANGNGKIKIDINEDSRNGTPRIEGLTKDQLAEIFGDRDSVILNDGGKTDKAWYSNSYTSPGGGQETVTSMDGLDTILDFTSGEDKLDFSDITQQQFADNFTVVVGADTVITNNGDASWSLTLSGVTEQLAPGDIIFA